MKWDSLQFTPDQTAAIGAYNSVPITIPAPSIRVQSSPDLKNKIVWGPQVEGFTNAQAGGRLRAPLSHYKVLRSPQPLGPWAVIDSVGKHDVRYYQSATSEYIVRDPNSRLSESYYYCVVSVDTLGNASAMTNRQMHTTNRGSEASLNHVYVAPNPLIVTSTFGGSASVAGVDINDKIGFFGLTAKATIRIFSYSGQLVQTIEHEDIESNSVEWFQITRNNQLMASGVYFFVVDDPASGNRVKGKFVVIH